MSTARGITFFKYRDMAGNGLSYFEDMMRTNQIIFSSPQTFNDPFDCRVRYDIGNKREDIVSRFTQFLFSKGRQAVDARAQAEKEVPFESFDLDAWQVNRIGRMAQAVANSAIFCLCERNDDSIMWTHYANSHSGICVRFSARDEAHAAFIGEAQLVTYSKRCPVINLVHDDLSSIAQKLVLTKGEPFYYEHEWRIIRISEAPGLKPIPQGIIDAVYLGVSIADNVKERVIRACESYQGAVEIWQAVLDPESYGFKFELVTEV